mgnify:CR=1 FL=1
MTFGQASANAIQSSGFWKALGYSLVSAIVAGLIVFINEPATTQSFPKLVLLVPLVNAVLVWLKKTLDELKKQNPE